MKKVLLVDPPFHAFSEYDRWWYSYSCAQLAACLREKGIEAYVYDSDKYFKKDPRTSDRKEMVRRQNWYSEGLKNNDHYIWQHFKKTLNEINPDIVGVASWTSKLQSTFKILEISKTVNPEIITCVGGYHATALPATFTNHKHIDAVFVGPAEHSLPEWILNGCNKSLIIAKPQGIDLKKTPFPDRGALLFPEHYSSTDMGMLMTSRGCPYDCTFCSNKMITARYYQHYSVDQVRRELQHIVDNYNVDYLNVADANFLVNLKKSYKMIELFKEFGIPWGTEGRIDIINDELLETLIDSGCSSLCFGIETGTNKGMKLLNKGITIEQVEQASKILSRHKIKWKCFFIVGFPHETLEDMEKTRSFALNLGASYISLNSFVPLPGTEIYNTWASIFDDMSYEELSEYNQLNPKATFIPGVSPEAYREKFLQILSDFEEYNDTLKMKEEFHGAQNFF
jgi:anaerobic magnesium-protoporphyrin IX monomethyl ester cyclase